MYLHVHCSRMALIVCLPWYPSVHRSDDNTSYNAQGYEWAACGTGDGPPLPASATPRVRYSQGPPLPGGRHSNFRNHLIFSHLHWNFKHLITLFCFICLYRRVRWIRKALQSSNNKVIYQDILPALADATDDLSMSCHERRAGVAIAWERHISDSCISSLND